MGRLEHIGIAVDDAEAATRVFEVLLGVGPYKIEAVEREGVNTLFIDAGGPKLELLDSTNDDSPVARFLERRGPGVHHLAIEVPDVEAELVRVRGAGFTVLSDEPLDGADGKRVFFVHPRDCHGVLVEFCQQTRTTWMEATIEMPHGVVPVYTAGSRESTPVLLLHDQDSSARADFDELLPVLERTMFAVCFDAPGHGGARGWEPGTSILRAADKHARAVLQALDVSQPAIVGGRGAGAIAAIQTAASFPMLVRALALVNPVELDDAIAPDEMPRQPVLICCSTTASLPNTLRAVEGLDTARLSVIPDVPEAARHLAELIAGMVEWT